MDTITCPKCGTENPADAVNCKECRINLQWALENWVNHERILLDEETKREQAEEEKQILPIVRWWIKMSTKRSLFWGYCVLLAGLSIIIVMEKYLKWSGYYDDLYWFIPAVLVIVILAKYLDLLPGVILASGIGIIIFFEVYIESVLSWRFFRDILHDESDLIPFVIPTLCGLFFSIIGELIDKKGSQAHLHRGGVRMAIIGLAVGSIIKFFLLIPLIVGAIWS